jgi:hypothetical protein
MLTAVAIRNPQPAEPPTGAGGTSAGPAMRWRVDRRYLAAKIGVLVAAVTSTVLMIIGSDRPGSVLAAAVSLAAAGYLLRDLVAPVSLAADQHGMSVRHGFAARARLSWAEIERIQIDQRTRLGIPSETLEIDAGAQLFLLGRGDLGAAPAEVARKLSGLRPPA